MEEKADRPPFFSATRATTVTPATDGAEALELIDPCAFDLVLSDVRMSSVDGITVVTHLRSTSPEIPLIILTTYPSDAAGIVGMPRALVMAPPIMLAHVESRIRVLLQQW